jgi:spore coat polysaccharide biosynthesis protein SpsF (cytidylyltransferase family)
VKRVHDEMHIIAIIQARCGSTRLRKKVLLDLEGKTVLERVIQRVRGSELVTDVVVATTVAKEDLEIVKLCSGIGVSVYCGSEDDVLDRYYQAARLFKADHVVRITADCPLMDPKVIGDVIAYHLREKADYTSNIINETYPDGEDVEVFKFEALKKACQIANLASEREHVTSYIRKNPGIFRLASVEYKENLGRKRWTLDNPEDYEFVKAVYKNLYSQNPLFGMKEVLKFVGENPEIEKINQHITRNEGYLKSLREDKILNLDCAEDH